MGRPWAPPARSLEKEQIVPQSVLEAIKLGNWNFEPIHVEGNQYTATEALPGSQEKLDILAQRARQGLPLWHPGDRRSIKDDDLFDD